MPDTGAPWNIPYVESTDLVSGWPTDSLALANAIADGLDAAGNAGIGSNVVQTLINSPVSTTSTTYVDATGVAVTITPSSASAKVLVVCSLNLVNSQNRSIDFQITATSGTSPFGFLELNQANTAATSKMAVWSVLHSPATTSAVTYQIQWKIDAAQSQTISNNNTTSSITAIEVAA